MIGETGQLISRDCLSVHLLNTWVNLYHFLSFLVLSTAIVFALWRLMLSAKRKTSTIGLLLNILKYNPPLSKTKIAPTNNCNYVHFAFEINIGQYKEICQLTLSWIKSFEMLLSNQITSISYIGTDVCLWVDIRLIVVSISFSQFPPDNFILCLRLNLWQMLP